MAVNTARAANTLRYGACDSTCSSCPRVMDDLTNGSSELVFIIWSCVRWRWAFFWDIGRFLARSIRSNPKRLEGRLRGDPGRAVPGFRRVGRVFEAHQLRRGGVVGLEDSTHPTRGLPGSLLTRPRGEGWGEGAFVTRPRRPSTYLSQHRMGRQERPHQGHDLLPFVLEDVVPGAFEAMDLGLGETAGPFVEEVAVEHEVVHPPADERRHPGEPGQAVLHPRHEVVGPVA